MVQIPTPGPGQRLSIRHVDADGAHDLVGELVRLDGGELVLLPLGRGPVRVPVASVRAARVAPPRAVRTTSAVDDVQRLAARGWPGLEVERLGGWELHFGDGWTGRANSCLPLGSPELELGEALAQVEQRYRASGLRPSVQVGARDLTTGDEPGRLLDRHLAELGWQARNDSLVMVRDLRRPQLEPASQRLDIAWHEAPTDQWLALEPDEHPARVPVLTSAPAQYGLTELDGRPVGCARLSRTDDWAGLSCVYLAPELRGQGLGRALVLASLHRAIDQGARFCYLQVVRDNAVARGLYETLGFLVHHEYRYRVAPDA